jgi:hypothetical protein
MLTDATKRLPVDCWKDAPGTSSFRLSRKMKLQHNKGGDKSSPFLFGFQPVHPSTHLDYVSKDLPSQRGNYSRVGQVQMSFQVLVDQSLTIAC